MTGEEGAEHDDEKEAEYGPISVIPAQAGIQRK